MKAEEQTNMLSKPKCRNMP